MLFSDDKIAQLISKHFEPTWQNVRSVPIVTIDFGGGNVLTRTLNGNIATYVCTPDGKVLDILPGIYEPNTYQYELDQFAKLIQWVKQDDQDDIASAITRYHELQAKARAENESALELARLPNFAKKRIEGPTKLALMPKKLADEDKHFHANLKPKESAPSNMHASDDVARWDVLIQDTQVNQTLRRRVIHEYLAATSLSMPSDIEKWLYREVLDADLDDPYLGLGKTLFASYPFDDH